MPTQSVAFALAFAVVLGSTGRLPAEAPNLEPVRKWIARAARIRSVDAEFIQERHLKTLSRPLVSAGRLWFQAPGSVRWQTGQPPKTIALQARPGADFFVLDTRQKKVEVFSATGSSPRRGQILTFIEAGFPRTLEEFQKRFRIEAVESSDGSVLISGALNDRRASVAVLKVVFVVDEAAHALQRLEVWFRDGSKIFNRFTRVRENAEVDDGIFKINLDGYRVERHE